MIPEQRTEAALGITRPTPEPVAEAGGVRRKMTHGSSPITHEQAREALKRFENMFWKRDGWPRVSIPARPGEDDDLVLHQYIDEQKARAQPPQPTRTLKGMIADIYEGMDAEDCAMIDKAWREFRSPSQPTGDVLFDEQTLPVARQIMALVKGSSALDVQQQAGIQVLLNRLCETVTDRANSRLQRLEQEAVEDAIVIGRLNGGKELQDLMALNNRLLARVAELEKALEPFARWIEKADGPVTEFYDRGQSRTGPGITANAPDEMVLLTDHHVVLKLALNAPGLTAGDFRRARAALSPTEQAGRENGR